MQRTPSQRGFTLLELATVAAIIGVLAGVAAPSFLGWRTMMRTKGAAREIASMLRLARTRSLEQVSRPMVVFYRGVATDASDDRVAMFTGVPETPESFDVTSLTTAMLDGVTPPPAPLVFAGAANSDSTIKYKDVGLGPGYTRTFPYPYTAVTTSASCSFCGGSWGALIFNSDPDNPVSVSSGSAVLPSQTFVSITVSPQSEWASGVKNAYTVILNVKTGGVSVWNPSDK